MLSFTKYRALLSITALSSTSLVTGLDHVSSRLEIHIPHDLYKENGYDHRDALFGIPAYGGSIAQNLYYADSNLCDPNVDATKGYPQREVGKDGKMEPWSTPFILMVDRGGCSFVQKVRNAQRAGAAGVVIADNTCLCIDKECREVNDQAECQNSEPIMADDGSGADITVPSFLMFKHDADKVKDEVMQNNMVQMEMTWALPSPDDRVEYDLWTTPTEYASKDFLTTFLEMAKALGDKAYFTPHMFIYDGTRNGCTGAGKNQCYNLCTNNGRYCAIDPDNDLDRGVSGADVVNESLRRICIWKHYGEADGIGIKWWEYVNTFIQKCQTSLLFKDEACVNSVYKETQVDKAIIDQCMRDSGGLLADASNTFLQEEIEAQQRRGIVILPSAFVNTAAIRGALSLNNVFGAICSGYLDGTKPPICQKCAECPDKLSCATSGTCSTGTLHIGVSFHTFLTSLFLVGFGFAAVGVYQYRMTQRDMREQVRGILAEYMPLEDQEGPGLDDNPATQFARNAGESLIS